MIMLKEAVKKNQKDTMKEGWYPQRKVEKVSSTMEELDVKRGLAENEESEEHIFIGENQSKCCTISSHIKGVNQNTREEEDYNVTLSSTEKHKLLRLKADKMYRRNAERMQLKYSKAKRKIFVHSQSVTL